MRSPYHKASHILAWNSFIRRLESGCQQQHRVGIGAATLRTSSGTFLNYKQLMEHVYIHDLSNTSPLHTDRGNQTVCLKMKCNVRSKLNSRSSPTNIIQHPQFLWWYQLTSIKITQIMTRHASNMTFSGLISPEPMLVMLVADVHSRFTDFYIYNVTCILMFNAMQLCYICKHHLNNTRIRISSGKYIFIYTQINK